MIYSVGIPYSIHLKAINHLVRPDQQEDLCFAIWYPSQGQIRITALIQQIILPLRGERRVYGNVSFLPSYFERALQLALKSNAGLALMHSHLTPGWQGMSHDDIKAEQEHAAATFGITGLPLLGLTIGIDGSWSARFWERTAPRQYKRIWCVSVRVVGKRFSSTYNDDLLPPPDFRTELTRTVSAWGQKAQSHLARLHIGIVGAGSVGSIIAETLARMGISHISLIDFDSIEKINLDRLLHATIEDVENGRSKVETLSCALKKSATASPFTVDSIEYSVAEEKGFKMALDCDVLFSCVDRPWPRAILNFIAYAHLIPVVDGGIRIETTKNGQNLKRADWRAHIATVDRPCLECLEQYDAGLVSAEREGYLDNPRYIQGLPADHAIKRNENVFGFSLSVASLEILQFLAMIIAPLGQSNPGTQYYHFVTGMLDTDLRKECNTNCAFTKLVALGDRTGMVITGRHKIAELKRQERLLFQRNKSNASNRIHSFFNNICNRIKAYHKNR